MEQLTHTSPAEINGEQLADALYEQKVLKTAKTIGDVREGLDGVMNGVGKEGDVGARLSELKTSLDEATESGHNDVVLQDKIDGDDHVLGQHTFESGQAEVRRDQFTPAVIAADTRRKTLQVVVEEDKKGVGHPGQNPKARANVIYDGKHQSLSTALEGEVGANIAKDVGARTDIPVDVYQEGEEMVDDLGPAEVGSYVRKGGANEGEHMQKLVWEKDPTITFDQMMEEGVAVGMSTDEIIRAAQEQGKFDQNLTPVLAA